MADPPLRKRRYPASVERGRSALVAAATLMALVGIALMDELTGPKHGLGVQVMTDFHRWFSELRGARLGLTATQMAWVVTSLHLLTAAFLLVLDLLGGRSAYLSAFKVAAPVVFVWGTGIAAVLGAYEHFALCAGLGAGAFLTVILISVGIIVGNDIRADELRAEAQAAQQEEDEDEYEGDEEESDEADRLHPGESEPDLDPAVSDAELDRVD